MMKNVVLGLLLLLVTCACSKDDDFATTPTDAGIVGRWKLVETRVSDGATTHNVDVQKENYIITFHDDLRVEASDFTCTGTYSYNPDQKWELGKGNTEVVFKDCATDKRSPHSVVGSSNLNLSDDNTLHISYPNCIEQCTRVFRRLK